MRDIKFRVFCKTYKFMSELDDKDLFLNNDGLYERKTVDYQGDEYNYASDNFILMQYTGLKDKNGVDIYEGDIVRLWKPEAYDVDDVVLDEKNCEKTSASNIIDLTGSELSPDGHVVDWNKSYARWQVGLYGGGNPICGEAIFEVIGNIHENKLTPPAHVTKEGIPL